MRTRINDYNKTKTHETDRNKLFSVKDQVKILNETETATGALLAHTSPPSSHKYARFNLYLRSILPASFTLPNEKSLIQFRGYAKRTYIRIVRIHTPPRHAAAAPTSKSHYIPAFARDARFGFQILIPPRGSVISGTAVYHIYTYVRTYVRSYVYPYTHMCGVFRARVAPFNGSRKRARGHDDLSVRARYRESRARQPRVSCICVCIYLYICVKVYTRTG